MADLLAGPFEPLPKRQLTVESCQKWGYRLTQDEKDAWCQVADYYDPAGDAVVAQKVRYADKSFHIRGDMKKAGLYGQHLWRDKGKMVVVTEGEIDAITVSQLQQHKWPVVSVNNGAQGAKKALAKQLEWLLGFDHVILMFDNDEPGRKAVQECAELFPPGRCKVATLPLKDPNEMLVAGKGGGVIEAMWGAKVYRPDGLVTIKDLRERVLLAPEDGLPWFLPTLTKLTYGRRMGECYAVGAGTGVGKTDFLTQQINHDLLLGEQVGAFFLEQQPEETFKRVAGKRARRRFHIPAEAAGWSQEELVFTADELERGPQLHLYDSFGATDWEVILSRTRYLAKSEGVRIFYLDHLTALAAAEDDERRALEKIMAEIGSAVKELRICLTFVSHLATPEGKPHEEGGRVMIRHFKGSRAIGFWSHFMFALERNQQAADKDEQRQTTFRVLKDRYTGNATGQTFGLGYDDKTGLLSEKGEVSFEPESEEAAF